MATAEKEKRRRAELIYLALIAKEAGRSDDMLDSVCKAARLDPTLSDWERNFLSASFEEVINVKKAVLGTTAYIQQEGQKKGNEFAVNAAKEFRLNLVTEIEKTCSIVLDLLNHHIIPSAIDPETSVFFHKMAVECHFKVAEVMDDSLKLIKNAKDIVSTEAFEVDTDRNKAFAKSLEAQEFAWETAKEKLPASNFMRLDLALRMAHMFYKLDCGARAYKLVQEALGDAKVELKSNIRSKETKSAMSELKGFLTWLEGINDRAHRTANQYEQSGRSEGVKPGNKPDDDDELSVETMETVEKEKRRRLELIHLALIAKKAGRSDDVLDAMCKVAKLGPVLSDWERKFLSTSFEEVINVKKALFKKAAYIQQNEQQKGNEVSVDAAKEFRQTLVTEIEKTCYTVLDLLNNHLIPSSIDPETSVYFHKMAVECHFKVAEVMDESWELMRNPKDLLIGKYHFKAKMDRNRVVAKSLEAQEFAWKTAKEKLPAASVIRLDLAMRMSHMFYRLDSGARAYKLVKEALDDAKAELKSSISSEETKRAMSDLQFRLTWLGSIDDGAHRSKPV